MKKGDIAVDPTGDVELLGEELASQCRKSQETWEIDSEVLAYIYQYIEKERYFRTLKNKENHNCFQRFLRRWPAKEWGDKNKITGTFRFNKTMEIISKVMKKNSFWTTKESYFQAIIIQV